jgi:hypothetical protein
MSARPVPTELTITSVTTAPAGRIKAEPPETLVTFAVAAKFAIKKGVAITMEPQVAVRV